MLFYKKKLLEKIDQLNQLLTKSNFIEISNLIGNKRQLFFRNFLSGVFRGIGIGVGFTLVTAIIVLFLRKIVALNLPIIGEFVSDIIDIVKYNKKF